MRSQALFALLATWAWSTAAAPAAEQAPRPSRPGLRLIKTSPEDHGKWVTEEQKIEFRTKGINFIDITDITDEEVLTALSSPNLEPADSFSAQAVTYPSRVSHQTEANALIAQASTTNPKNWLQTLTNYHNRHYRSTYGTQAGTWLYNTVKNIASVNPAITVTQFTHSFNQPSIIVQIPGNSTNLVIVGAHYDSTAGSSSARSPGADDNGSGVVTILEALRVLANAKFKGKNTIEFHFYAGEEAGLLGSAAIFSNYKSNRKTVLAMLNQDMTGYSPNGKLAVYTDYVDSSLTSYVRVIANAYIGSVNTDRCGYGCSDHASARSNGFPAAYVCEDTMDDASPYIHTANDAYSTIMWDAVLRHIKFTLAFLVEASYL